MRDNNLDLSHFYSHSHAWAPRERGGGTDAHEIAARLDCAFDPIATILREPRELRVKLFVTVGDDSGTEAHESRRARTAPFAPIAAMLREHRELRVKACRRRWGERSTNRCAPGLCL